MLLILTNQRLTFFFPSLTSHSFHSSLPTLQLGTSRKSNVRFPEFYSVLGPVNPKKQVLLCSQRQETQQLAGVEVLVRSFLMSPSMLTSTLPASMLWFFLIFFFNYPSSLASLGSGQLVKWTTGPIWHLRNSDCAPGSWEKQLSISISFTKAIWVCLEGAALWYLEEQSDKRE